MSVRSGAKFSMPGMMDTVLNLGLNDESVEGLAKQTDDERFAFDSYRRFLAMYGRIVLDVEGEHFERLLDTAKEWDGATTDADVTAETLRRLCDRYKDVVAPGDGQRRSRRTPSTSSAAPSRRCSGPGTAPGPSPTGSGSGSATTSAPRSTSRRWCSATATTTPAPGVGFTRNAATGENKPYGDFLVNAQGEDVVAGIRNTEDLDALAEQFPKIHKELLGIFDRLEAHYRDMCDTEFTIEQGKLWMLQTRVGKRTGAAALRMAVEMTKGRKWKISHEEAIQRITEEHLEQMLHPDFARSPSADELLTHGLAASPGAAVGRVYFTADDAADAADRGEKVILVRSETSPEDVHGMIVAEGILTARGGLVSHAAVVARGWGKPAVVGAESIRIAPGRFVVRRRRRPRGRRDLDLGLGRLRRPRRAARSRRPRRPSTWRRSSTGPTTSVAGELGGAGQRRQRTRRRERPRLRRRGHRPVPDRAHVPRRGPPADRPPHDPRRHAGARRRPPSRSCGSRRRPTSRRSSRRWTACPSRSGSSTRPCTSSCPSTEELAIKEATVGLTDEEQELYDAAKAWHEFNPMLGTRGVRLGVIKPGLYAMQVRALMEAAAERVKKGGTPVIEIMIPLTITQPELTMARGWCEDAIAEAQKKTKKPLEVTIGTMIETPRACLRADDIALEADFFSFGTNDLTQMTLGFSRDDVEGRMMEAYLEHGLLKRNPFETIDEHGVGELVKHGGDRGAARPSPGSSSACAASTAAIPSRSSCSARPGSTTCSCSPFRVPDRPSRRRAGGAGLVQGRRQPVGCGRRRGVSLRTALVITALWARAPWSRSGRERPSADRTASAERTPCSPPPSPPLPRTRRLGTSFAYLDVEAWHWLALVGFITALVVIDLLLVHRTAHVITIKEAAIESAVWISIGLAFTGVIYLLAVPGDQHQAAGEYLSGFLIEKSLSIDNVFVWAVIFSYFAVPREYQFRVLFWGIFGALVLRAVFIFAGVALIEQFEWVLYVFGAFLLVTAWRIAHHDETAEVDYSKSKVLGLVRRIVPSTDHYDGQKLFTDRERQAGGDTVVRRAGAHRGDRRRVRRRLRPGDPRHQPRAVHRVQLERLRHPRPALAVLPARRAWRDGSAT